MQPSTKRSGAWAIALLGVLPLGCERGGSNFDENVEKTVGDPQQSQGMFGGNSAPAATDAGAACCAQSGDASP